MDFLAHRFRYHSREVWEERIDNRCVLVNGYTAHPQAPVFKGDVITYTILHREPEVDFRYEVIYEDEHLLAVSKSGNLPVHACGVYITHTLVRKIQERFGEGVSLAHRLDRETSGLVLLSKGPSVARLLGRMFREGRVRKEYFVVVFGRIGLKRFEVNASIGKTSCSKAADQKVFEPGEYRGGRGGAPFRLEPKRRVDALRGKPARTRFYVERVVGGFTALKALPLTGRTNQIRVHLSHIGFPVVGDKVYGISQLLKEEYLRCGMTDRLRRALVLDRQALHCRVLQFVHPVTRARMHLEARVPEDLQGLLQAEGGFCCAC